MKEITLISPHSKDECARRLESAVRPWWQFYGGRSPVGRVRPDTFWLRVRIWYGNSFQTILRGRMAENESGGTTISCQFGMRRFVVGLMIFWFAGVVILGGALFAKALGQLWHDGVASQAALSGIVVPVSMVLFGFGLVKFGQFLARNEGAELSQFVRVTLDAREPN